MPLILLPLIAVVADAVYLTITKVFFRHYGKLTSREFIWLQFIGIVLVLALAMPFFGGFPALQKMVATGWQLGLVVVLAVAGNVLYFWGIEHEKISEVEPFLLFNPLVAILIAGFIYPDERSWTIYLAAALAGGVLLWSHFKKHHFAFTKGLWAIALFMVVYGLEVALIKSLLEVYSPLTLYFMRCVLVLLALSIFVKPNFSSIKTHHLAPFGILGALAVASITAAYTSFHQIGISGTVIIFVLSPILVYLLSVIFLREKWGYKNAIASVVVTIIVILVSLINRL